MDEACKLGLGHRSPAPATEFGSFGMILDCSGGRVRYSDSMDESEPLTALTSLTFHNVLNDACTRRVRADRATGRPYKLLSFLLGTPTINSLTHHSNT